MFLLAVFGLSATSILLRPQGTDWSAWWPASGLAIGVAARFERRHLWSIAAAIGAVSALASLVNGREVPLALWAGVAIAAEVWIGAVILRGPSDRKPRLLTTVDLYRLLVCALISSATLGLVGGLMVAVLRGINSYLPAVIASVPAHAVGVLVVAPMLILKRSKGGAGTGEALAIWATLVVVLGVSFGLNVGLPIAFLAGLPLTWGATRLAPRHALWMMLAVATTVTVFSLSGRGPFAITMLPPDVSVIMLQLFNLSFAIVSLTLIVLTSQRRRLSATVAETASLFRTTFDFSPVGSAVVTTTSTGPKVDQLNAAGRDLLGLEADDPVVISEQLSDDSFAVLSGVIGQDETAGAAQWRGIMTLRNGRSLQVLLSGLPSELIDRSFAIQFFDITEQLRQQQAAAADLARAGQVQQALLPKELTPLPGYEVAGACVPAKSVGGDFYDWYPVQDGLAFTLGDVMGKGVGAGMIATATRAALRSARREGDVTMAVSRAADMLNTEVAEVNSFTTLFHGRIEAATGALEYIDAGHGLAIILRADGTVDHVASSDMPLGVMISSSWTRRYESLHPGDTLIVISDGVLELYDGTLAALDRVADLARLAPSPDDLAAKLAELAGQSAEPEDDSTIIVIRRAAGAQPVHRHGAE